MVSGFSLRQGMHDIQSVHVVAGVLETVITYDNVNKTVQQWKTIKRIYSQEFYRHPQYNLAILVGVE